MTIVEFHEGKLEKIINYVTSEGITGAALLRKFREDITVDNMMSRPTLQGVK